MKRFLAASLLFFSVFAVYSRTLSYPFVWDDGLLVKNNAQIRRLSFTGRFFTQDMFGRSLEKGDAYYRPLQMASHAVDYALWGPGPKGPHFMNWVWHGLAGYALFLLLEALFLNYGLSLCAALLFAVHPVHTASVAYISGRADPLSAFFLFLALHLHLVYSRQRRTRHLLAACAAFAAALLAKETALLFPALAVLCGWTARAKLPRRAILAYLALGALYVCFRLPYLAHLTPASASMPLLGRLPGAFYAVARYLGLLIWPHDLHLGRGLRLFSFGHPGVWAGMAVTAACLAAWALREKTPRAVTFSILWFWATLLPVLNIFVPMNEWMADHWLYLPSAGFFVLVGYGLGRLAGKGLKKTAGVVFAALFLLFSWGTCSYARVWHDPAAFFERMLKYNPGYKAAYLGLGNDHLESGRATEALACFEKARLLAPEDPDVYVDLGAAKEKMGRDDEAVTDYKKALSLDPDHIYALMNMAAVLLHRGEPAQAQKYYERCLVLQPGYLPARAKLANLLLDENRPGEALEHFRKALESAPDSAPVRNGYGIALAASGRGKEAAEEFRRVLKSDPGFKDAEKNLELLSRPKQER